MRFLTDLDLFPLILLICFGAAYVLYLGKIFYKARKIRTSPKGVLYKLVIRTLVFLLLIISFLGPLIPTEDAANIVSRKDIFLAIDLTSAMGKSDLQPSRLKRAVHVAKQIVSSSENVRFGIITFSDIPYMYAPLTSDKEAITGLLESIDESLLVEKQADNAEPILLASEKFSESPEDTQKLLIVFSGTSSWPDNSIAGSGFNLFRIFVSGQENEDFSGNIIPHFQINNDSRVKHLLSEIDAVASDISSDLLSEYSENVYSFFLIPAFLLLLMDCLITVNVLKL